MWSDTLAGWAEGKDLPHPPYTCFWQTYGLVSTASGQPQRLRYHEVFLPARGRLVGAAYPDASWFAKLDDTRSVAFASTGRSGATLVCPPRDKRFTDIHQFYKLATPTQYAEFWAVVTEEVRKHLKRSKPGASVYVSTDGRAVRYLHVRIGPIAAHYKSE